MKTKFAILAAILALGFGSAAAAQTVDCAQIDISKYNSTQLENVKSLCKDMNATVGVQAAAKEVTPAKVKEWAEIGKDFSTAVVQTAAGLGQTANQFLFTPLGILIAFYFLWGKIGGILIGIPLLIGLWTLYGIICRRYSKLAVEYENVPILWGAFTVRKVKSIDYANNGDVIGVWVCVAIPAVLISIGILAFLIF